MATVSLKSINKWFGSSQVLNDISLEIKDKEFVVFVGPSGCGKTTLLRIIAGLEEATSGDIEIDGEEVSSAHPIERGISMVFQSYALYPHLNVFENIAFPLRVAKMPKEELEKQVMRAAETLRLTDRLQHKPGQLSGGQRQRVAIGRSIVRHPKVFLFDEPLSNLDANLRSEMRLEIKKLHQLLGTTMIYVTHDQTEAMTMGDRIAVMNEGVIEQLDTPRNLYDHPNCKFVASCIGSPEMNFIEGCIKVDDNFHFINDDISLQIPNNHSQVKSLKSDDSVFIGIRPEDFHDEFWSDGKNETATLMSKVELVENLGANMIVHCQTGNTRFTVNLSKISNFVAGADINNIVDMTKTHFFNIENGNIL